MPRSTQVLASSSGIEAPSRKLNADRAWSSVYINRRIPVQTSSVAAHCNKSDTHRIAATGLHLSRPARQKLQNKSPDPTPLDPSRLPATILRNSATDLTPPRPRLAFLRNKCAQGVLALFPRSLSPPDEALEIQPPTSAIPGNRHRQPAPHLS